MLRRATRHLQYMLCAVACSHSVRQTTLACNPRRHCEWRQATIATVMQTLCPTTCASSNIHPSSLLRSSSAYGAAVDKTWDMVETQLRLHAFRTFYKSRISCGTTTPFACASAIHYVSTLGLNMRDYGSM